MYEVKIALILIGRRARVERPTVPGRPRSELPQRMEKPMSRPGRRHEFQPGILCLEDRKLLSGRGIIRREMAANAVAIHPLDALTPPQNRPFLLKFNFRREVGTTQSRRVSEAFQAFSNHVLGLPVTITGIPGTFGGNTGGGGGQVGPPVDGVAIGTVPNPPTLPNYVALLSGQVTRGLSTIQISSSHTVNTIRNGPRFAPRAYQALVPFAQEQIEQLGAYLAANPPKFYDNGALATPDSLAAVNTAFNAIENAIAETVAHPKLFVSPSDYFINPKVKFELPFSGDPLSVGPGFFGIGPHGVPLRPGH
jgi:hypothetical protein